MVARFVDVNNLSWQRRAFDFRTMEEKYGLTFCSWMQSYTGKSYMSIIFSFCFIFLPCHICMTTVCWDPDICLPWQRDVTTSFLYCLPLFCSVFLKRVAFSGKKFCSAGILNWWFSAMLVEENKGVSLRWEFNSCSVEILKKHCFVNQQGLLVKWLKTSNSLFWRYANFVGIGYLLNTTL